MADYSKEQLQELYKNLPKELQEAVFSKKNGDKIYESCARNGIKEDGKINGVAKYTGHVLLGLLSPDNLQKKLEEEVKIKKDKAEQIALEINRFVFSPVKDSLETLYKIEIKADLKTREDAIPSLSEEKPKREDTYRESIE